MGLSLSDVTSAYVLDCLGKCPWESLQTTDTNWWCFFFFFYINEYWFKHFFFFTGGGGAGLKERQCHGSFQWYPGLSSPDLAKSTQHWHVGFTSRSQSLYTHMPRLGVCVQLHDICTDLHVSSFFPFANHHTWIHNTLHHGFCTHLLWLLEVEKGVKKGNTFKRVINHLNHIDAILHFGIFLPQMLWAVHQSQPCR